MLGACVGALEYGNGVVVIVQSRWLFQTNPMLDCSHSVVHRFNMKLPYSAIISPAEALVLRPVEIRNAVGDFGRLPNGLSGLGIPTAAASRVRRLRVLRQPSQLHLVKVRRVEVFFPVIQQISFYSFSNFFFLFNL